MNLKLTLSALVSGVLFGLGLSISQMTDPAKVIGFLDITGNWDPSLALVMGSALLISILAHKVRSKRPSPILANNFDLPTKKHIDFRLIGGSILFGVGWGLVGLCPGPAIASIAQFSQPLLIFLAAMLISMLIAKKLLKL
jgi:uncharacterized membrane protein YedE/YeeE